MLVSRLQHVIWRIRACIWVQMRDGAKRRQKVADILIHLSDNDLWLERNNMNQSIDSMYARGSCHEGKEPKLN